MGHGFLIENEGLEHFWGNLGGVGAFEVHDMPASLTLEEEVDAAITGITSRLCPGEGPFTVFLRCSKNHLGQGTLDGGDEMGMQLFHQGGE